MMNIKIPNDKRRACSANSAIFVEEDLDEIGRFKQSV